MTVDAVDAPALAARSNAAPATDTAPPAIRVRLLEAELRAERRHAATTEERLRHAQASLQHALEQIEQHRITVAELQTVVQATAPRLITLEQALAERDRQVAADRHELQGDDGVAPTARADAPLEARSNDGGALATLRAQLRERDAACQALERELAATRTAHAAELERVCTEQVAHPSGTSDTDQRLHTAELTLEHTLRELEEARLAPIELRAALAAAEHRATTLAAQLSARDRTVAARRATRERSGSPPAQAGDGHAPAAATAADRVGTLETTIQTLHAQLEERRITCIELQTVLDATERQLAAVEAALAEREREFSETMERQAVLLRQATGERDELTRQLAGLGAAHAQASGELESLRGEHARLATRLRNDAAPPPAPPSPPPAPEPPRVASPQLTETAAPPAGPLTIVHIDDQPTGRDAVRAAVHRHAGTRYVCPQYPPAAAVRSATLFAINLLSRHLDPLAVVAEADKWGGQEPRAFTYCSDGTRAAVLGLIEYFPFPFDPDACAARLLERPHGAHRVLTVSNQIELMTRLRNLLSSGRCSTTVALDGRQALDLVKPVNPEIVLIDLALPRGEGWDLIARLHKDPTTAAIPIACLWTQKLGSGLFRQYATRLMQDWHGAGTNVGAALLDLLHTGQPGAEQPAGRDG